MTCFFVTRHIFRKASNFCSIHTKPTASTLYILKACISHLHLNFRLKLKLSKTEEIEVLCLCTILLGVVYDL